MKTHATMLADCSECGAPAERVQHDADGHPHPVPAGSEKCKPCIAYRDGWLAERPWLADNGYDTPDYVEGYDA